MSITDTVTLRRIVLRTMLTALAGSGAMALLAVFVPATDQAWRLAGTCLTATVASALLLFACRSLDRETTRQTALLAMALILVEFIIALAALWLPFGMSGYGSEELAALTAIFPLCALPAVGFFHIHRLPIGRWAGKAGISLCAAALFIFVIAICTDLRWSNNDHIWEAAWGLWLLAFLVSASLAGVGTDRRHWRWVGVVASIVAFVIAMRDLFWASADKPSHELVIVSTAAIVTGHVNLLLLCNVRPAHRWLRWATALIAVVAGIFVDGVIITEVQWGIWVRIAMASSICAACGTVAVALLTAFNRKVPDSQSISELTELSIICPACHKKQTIATGNTACTGCGLQFSIKLSAPRCPNCDYSLLMIRSSRCPECGHAVVATPAPLAAPAPTA